MLATSDPPIPSAPISPLIPADLLSKNHVSLDGSKIRETCGWRPARSKGMDEGGVREMLELFRKEGFWVRHPLPAARGLVHDLERVQAGAHEFAEIALIDDLRTRRVLLPESELHDAERLLGGEGMAPAVRLGLDPRSSPQEVRRAAAEQHLAELRRQ